MAAARATRTTTAIRLPAELHGQISEAAAARDMSINDLVILLCEYGLPRLRPFNRRRWFIDDEEETKEDSDADRT